jgi:hypothetical protein
MVKKIYIDSSVIISLSADLPARFIDPNYDFFSSHGADREGGLRWVNKVKGVDKKDGPSSVHDGKNPSYLLLFSEFLHYASQSQNVEVYLTESSFTDSSFAFVKNEIDGFEVASNFVNSSYFQQLYLG